MSIDPASLTVLALASYPEESAATRFRVCQMASALAGDGITVRLRSFLDVTGYMSLYRKASAGRVALSAARGVARRLIDLSLIGQVDLVLVQREAALFGPPVFEALAARSVPMVLDLDDPTWVPYDSPTYGRAARVLKWPSKTDWLIRHAAVVTCGSRVVLDYVTNMGADGRLVPTVVDLETFAPVQKPLTDDPPLVGWIGTHSTFPYLRSVIPALRAVAAKHPFRLLIVGAGQVSVRIPGADVRVLDWKLDREVADFQSLDIGLYPLVDDGWAAGKAGFKGVQYMAVGVPFVVTPLGATTEIGEVGKTHLEARSLSDWEYALELLIMDPERRRMMGTAGRAYCESQLTVEQTAGVLATALRDALQGGLYP